MSRIHVLIDPSEREAFRAQAAKEGRTLSEWLRVAGREKLVRARSRRLRSTADLPTFFYELDGRRSDDRPEEDWEAVKRRIAASKTPATDG